MVRIGISGWNYASWRGVFYPPGLPHRDELPFASRKVDSIEVNCSFYSLLRPQSVERWYDQAPPYPFVFAVKGSRFITHMKRLRDVQGPLANFFGSGVLAFEDKLGPILWQLPPQMPFDSARLANFFDQLPRTTTEAVALARRHDERIAGRSYVRTSAARPLRYALEVRHPSFLDPQFPELLRRHRVALCVADTAGAFPLMHDVTADFVYVRLHGEQKLYESGYDRASLRRWAARVRQFAEGGTTQRDVFVYFDNDAKVRAPFDARTLRALVDGLRPERLPRALSRLGGHRRGSALGR